MAASTSIRRPATRRPPAPRARTGIRWDRLGRWAMLFVLALVVYLYVGPTSNWISTYREVKARNAAVAELEAENARLKARRDELRRPATLEAEARRQGMLRAGEKGFVVRGLPPD